MDTVARTYRLTPEILVQISSLADTLTNQYGFRVSQNDVIRLAVRELYDRTKDNLPDPKGLIDDTKDDLGDHPLPVAR